MSWFFIALGAPFLWSLVNHADKYLLSRFLHDKGIGGLLIFSSLFSALLLPLFFLLSPENSIFSVELLDILKLSLAGCLSFFGILFYLKALEKDDASLVVPLFQVIPIFGFYLGFIFLGEILTEIQFLGSLVVILGGILLSLDFSKEATSPINTRIIGTMLLSSFFYALHETIFKTVAIAEDFFLSTFWQYVGLCFTGLILVISIPTYRRDFFDLLKTSGKSILTLNAVSEILTVGGNLLFGYASLLAPIALVMSVNAYQPVFVFFLGIMITLFWPKIARENMEKQELLKRSIAIIIICLGSYLIT